MWDNAAGVAEGCEEVRKEVNYKDGRKIDFRIAKRIVLVKSLQCLKNLNCHKNKCFFVVQYFNC